MYRSGYNIPGAIWVGSERHCCGFERAGHSAKTSTLVGNPPAGVRRLEVKKKHGYCSRLYLRYDCYVLVHKEAEH